MPKAEALAEAKNWLQRLDESQSERALEDGGLTRDGDQSVKPAPAAGSRRPYVDPYYWAGFILVGDPG